MASVVANIVLIAHFWSLNILSKYILQVLPHIKTPKFMYGKIKVQYNEYNMFTGMKCLSCVNTPIFLEIVFEIASM